MIYNSAKHPIAVYDANDRLIARYHYNGQGERIAKTVYPDKDTTALHKIAPEDAASQEPANGSTRYIISRAHQTQTQQQIR